MASFFSDTPGLREPRYGHARANSDDLRICDADFLPSRFLSLSHCWVSQESQQHTIWVRCLWVLEGLPPSQPPGNLQIIFYRIRAFHLYRLSTSTSDIVCAALELHKHIQSSKSTCLKAKSHSIESHTMAHQIIHLLPQKHICWLPRAMFGWSPLPRR